MSTEQVGGRDWKLCKPAMLLHSMWTKHICRMPYGPDPTSRNNWKTLFIWKTDRLCESKYFFRLIKCNNIWNIFGLVHICPCTFVIRIIQNQYFFCLIKYNWNIFFSILYDIIFEQFSLDKIFQQNKNKEQTNILLIHTFSIK